MGPDKEKHTQINFIDDVNFHDETICCPVTNPEPVVVSGEVKIFGHKYASNSAECIPGAFPGKGDDIVYTLVFGNYGDLTFKICDDDSTVVDTLTVEYPINLKLKNICTCKNFKVFNTKTNLPVKRCDIFEGGNSYELEIRKLKENGDSNCYDDYVPTFDLPCHSVYCVSMIFQIEFPDCSECN
ncbi:MAG: hypothetical protein E7213_03585 [Clostridium sp.]|nr:hypothetical protein [Clostridium sp.]